MEAMTSSVLDRMFSINNAPVEDNGTGAFFNNDNVMLIFSWVASAKEKPNENAAQGNLRVEENLAAFTYEGRWALFRMIEKHKISQGIEFPNGIVLLFNVPIVSKKDGAEVLTSKIVLKVTPMLRQDAKLSPLTWPLFPDSCPDLYNVKNKEKSEKNSLKKQVAQLKQSTKPEEKKETKKEDENQEEEDEEKAENENEKKEEEKNKLDVDVSFD